MGSEIYRILKDPAVREWWRAVVDAAVDAGFEPDVEGPLLRGAIEDPDIFETSEGVSLFYQFRQAYSAVASGVKSLAVSFQPFASRYNMFGDDPRQLFARRFRRNIDLSAPPLPPEIELARRYGGISTGAESVKGRIEKFKETISGAELVELMKRFESELDDIAEDDWTGLVSGRERIFEIDIALKRAEIIMGMGTEALFEVAAREMVNMMFVMDFAAEGMKQRLGELQGRLAAEMGLSPLDAAALGSGDGRLNEAVAEMHIRISELVRIGIGIGRIRSTLEMEPAGGRQPSFDELSRMAYEAMLTMAPDDSLRRMSGFTKNPLLVGAALIDAAFRQRMGDGSGAYLREIAPFIRVELVDRPQGIRGAASEGGIDEGQRISPAGGRIRERLLEESASGVFRTMHLELGGGPNPASLGLALRFPGAMFFSVDPAGTRISEEAAAGAGSVPENLLQLAGRAEELIPYVFHRPLFESALMVEPPSFCRVSMMLSAILAVKPGGAVDIYELNSRGFDFGFLERSGFEVREQRLDGADPSLPHSPCFRGGASVNRTTVIIPEEGWGGDGRAEGAGPCPIRRGTPGAPRPLTRKIIRRPPRGAVSVTEISAGIFAAPFNSPVASPCVVLPLSLFTALRAGAA